MKATGVRGVKPSADVRKFCYTIPTMQDLKTPPSNVEAERAVLGSIMLDTTGRSGDRVMDVCLTSGISPDSFFDPRNRTIFAAMLQLNRESKPLDSITLMESLRVKGQLEAVGGAAYLESLYDQTPTTAHAEYYIGLLRGKHLRRMIIERATKVVEKCYDEGEYPDSQAVLGEAEIRWNRFSCCWFLSYETRIRN